MSSGSNTWIFKYIKCNFKVVEFICEQNQIAFNLHFDLLNRNDINYRNIDFIFRSLEIRVLYRGHHFSGVNRFCFIPHLFIYLFIKSTLPLVHSMSHAEMKIKFIIAYFCHFVRVYVVQK